MKRTLATCLLGLTGLLATSCGEKAAPTPGGEAGKGAAEPGAETITLGVIPKSIGGDFWETVERGARQAAKKLEIEIKWEGTVTETEMAEQNKIIENMINLGVDGIALAPLNEKAQVKFARSAVEAGIPVVVFDSAMDWNGHSSFIATDNRRGGGTGGKILFELLEGRKRVMVMRFIQGAGSTEARAAGFLEVAKEFGLEVLADPYPDTGTIEGAKNAAVNTLEGFVKDGKLELDGIFACNLYSTLGVDAALGDLRKSGIEVDLAFVGFDTSKRLVEGVLEGRIDALIAQDPFRMGNLAVKTLHGIVTGVEVKREIDTGTSVVTRKGLETDAKIRRLAGVEK